MGEKWSDSGCLLMVEPSGFPEGLDVHWEKKRRVEVFGLSMGRAGEAEDIAGLSMHSRKAGDLVSAVFVLICTSK